MAETSPLPCPMIVGIDPGTVESAVLLWDRHTIHYKEILPNPQAVEWLGQVATAVRSCVIEMIACYGMPVGKDVFETVVWIGRMDQTFWHKRGHYPLHVYRKDIKLHHCNSTKAKDCNVRQALIDKYGAPGTKKAPGITYGLHDDLWSAFAIATYAAEQQLI